MYPALHHWAGCECMPIPWLCTFRKSELWRGKTTDWWFKKQSGHTTYSCANLEPSLEYRTYTSEFIANCMWQDRYPTTANQCGFTSHSYNMQQTINNQLEMYTVISRYYTHHQKYNHSPFSGQVAIYYSPRNLYCTFTAMLWLGQLHT